MNGTRALHQALALALAGDLPDLPGPVHLLGEALELSPVTAGLRQRFPARVHLLPAADAGLVGLAIGFAMSGAVAVVELADAQALRAALPQLAEAGALSSAEAPLRVVVRVPTGPEDGPGHLEAMVQGLPGVALASAGRACELVSLLQAALRHPGPVVLAEPRAVLAAHHHEEPPALPLGRARLLATGEHATVLAWGAAVGPAQDAVAHLAEEGIHVDLLDLRSLVPLDAATIGQRVAHTGRAVLAGPAEPALQAAVHHAFLRLEAPPARVAEPADALSIAAAVRAAVQF